MDTAAAKTEARWTSAASTASTTLTILLPVLALAAPLLTGTYYLVLASGSANAARQMMLVTDPIDTALAVTVGFFPALAAGVAMVAVVASRGRFHLALAYGVVFYAVVFSGLNLDVPLWHALGFASALNFLLAILVPPSYPIAILRALREGGRRPELEGWIARRVARVRWLDRTLVWVAISTFMVNAIVVTALCAGLFTTQFMKPAVYQLTFDGQAQPISVVWFSTNESGTWYVTEHTARDVDPDTAMGTRDLEWARGEPTSIVACDLSAVPCETG